MKVFASVSRACVHVNALVASLCGRTRAFGISARQQHRRTIDGRLCAAAFVQNRKTYTGCTDSPNPSGESGRAWCYVEAQVRCFFLKFRARSSLPMQFLPSCWKRVALGLRGIFVVSTRAERSEMCYISLCLTAQGLLGQVFLRTLSASACFVCSPRIRFVAKGGGCNVCKQSRRNS